VFCKSCHNLGLTMSGRGVSTLLAIYCLSVLPRDVVCRRSKLSAATAEEVPGKIYQVDRLKNLRRPTGSLDPLWSPEEAEDDEAASGSLDSEFSLVALTYNTDARGTFLDEAHAMNKILEQEDASILALCTQETEKPGMAASFEKVLHNWTYLGSRRNKGFTKSPTLPNHQELSLFVKLPKTLRLRRQIDNPWRKGDKDCLVSRKKSGLEEVKICARFAKVATSISGKGGVFAWLEIEKLNVDGIGFTKPFRLMTTCAHLDASSADKRTNNIRKLLAKTAGQQHSDFSTAAPLGDYGDGRVDQHSTDALDEMDAIRLPADSDAATNDQQKAIDVMEQNPFNADAAIILGDLNYRVNTWSATFAVETVAGLVLDHMFEVKEEGDQLLRQFDTLPTSELMKPYSAGGFGFACNSIGTQPPTYKIGTSEGARTACETLREAYNEHNKCKASRPGGNWGKICRELHQRLRSPKEREAMIDLVLTCYNAAEKDKQSLTSKWKKAWTKNKKRKEKLNMNMLDVPMFEENDTAEDSPPAGWSSKGGDLQLGWLDRVCWRTFESPRYQIIEDEDFGIRHEMPHVEPMSDHLPQMARITFRPTRKSEEAAPAIKRSKAKRNWKKAISDVRDVRRAEDLIAVSP